MTMTHQRFITIGHMGEGDIDKEATPQETFDNLVSVSEQCGYLTLKGEWGQYFKVIIFDNMEGRFFIHYKDDKFDGVFVKRRVQ